jgi:hypothetical protein
MDGVEPVRLGELATGGPCEPGAVLIPPPRRKQRSPAPPMTWVISSRGLPPESVVATRDFAAVVAAPRLRLPVVPERARVATPGAPRHRGASNFGSGRGSRRTPSRVYSRSPWQPVRCLCSRSSSSDANLAPQEHFGYGASRLTPPPRLSEGQRLVGLVSVPGGDAAPAAADAATSSMEDSANRAPAHYFVAAGRSRGGAAAAACLSAACRRSGAPAAGWPATRVPSRGRTRGSPRDARPLRGALPRRPTAGVRPGSRHVRECREAFGQHRP